MNKPYIDEAPVRRVAPLLIVLLAAIALILGVIAGLARLWHIDGGDTRPAGIRPEVSPALETAPQPALQDFLAEKQRIADSYAWVDRAGRVARIPIDEAMRALAMQSASQPHAAATYLMGSESDMTPETGKNAVSEQRQGNLQYPNTDPTSTSGAD